jgi:hypothetical protein
MASKSFQSANKAFKEEAPQVDVGEYWQLSKKADSWLLKTDRNTPTESGVNARYTALGMTLRRTLSSVYSSERVAASGWLRPCPTLAYSTETYGWMEIRLAEGAPDCATRQYRQR